MTRAFLAFLFVAVETFWIAHQSPPRPAHRNAVAVDGNPEALNATPARQATAIAAGNCP